MCGRPSPVQRDLRHHLRIAAAGLCRPARCDLPVSERGHQSGGIDWSGRIPKCGDRVVRGLLFEAASTLISGVARLSALKGWGIRLAGRRGIAKAVVAAAREPAVLMLSLWKNRAGFKWIKETIA